MNYKIFADSPNIWEDVLTVSRVDDFVPEEKAFQSATVLPLKTTDKNGVFLGGVVDKNGAFVGGCAEQLDFFSCKSAYEFSKDDIDFCDESVVYGGAVFSQFGIMLLRSLSRLWWVVDNPECNKKIVFLLSKQNETAKKYCEDVCALLGIQNDRIKIIYKPCRFSEVIVPQESYKNYRSFSKKYLAVFDKMKQNANSMPFDKHFDKVYFSRTLFCKNGKFNDGINEQYYENFYKKRGFFICHPETLTLAEQVYIISNAMEVVTTYGTLLHSVSLFAQNNAKFTVLLRVPRKGSFFEMQSAVFELRNSNFNIVEATTNPYPTMQDGGVFLYQPTKYFKNYLDFEKIDYDSDEIEQKITDEQVNDYIKRWLSIFSNPSNFKALKRPDVFPVLQSLYFVATGKKLNQEDFVE